MQRQLWCRRTNVPVQLSVVARQLRLICQNANGVLPEGIGVACKQRNTVCTMCLLLLMIVKQRKLKYAYA